MLFRGKRQQDKQDKKPETFLEDIRKFAPDYNEMADRIIALLQAEWPRRVLDIGSGAGNIDMMILDIVPASRIDCVEASRDMIKVSVSTLGRHLDRATLIHRDVMDFNPEGRYDAIMSNLVLHGMTREEKARLLARIHGWLADGGLFVWGDLIRQEQKEPAKEAWKKRLNIKLPSVFRRGAGGGAEKKTEEKTPQTETKTAQDYPLTEEETIRLCSEAGFSGAFAAWKRGNFAVFSMRK